MVAKVKHARVAAAHEGIAEMVVAIEYDNGGVTEVCLDSSAVEALMRSTNASSLEDLQGAEWDKVRDALSASYNRYA